MVEKGMTCVKYLLFAFNLLFFIFGAVLIGVGAYVQVQLRDYLAFSESMNATAILIIVVGALTLIIGFFGCCGAYKENSCMVMTFAGLITIILICEVGGGIAAFVLQSDIQTWLGDGMKDTMDDYSTDEGVKDAWDATQQEFKCCGTNNQTDWPAGQIPNSCCKDSDCSNSPYYDQGCLTALEDFLSENIVIVAGIGIGLGVVELLGVILSCCLARAIRSEYTTV